MPRTKQTKDETKRISKDEFIFLYVQNDQLGKNKLSQSKLADKMNLPLRTFYDWLKKYRPEIDELYEPHKSKLRFVAFEYYIRRYESGRITPEEQVIAMGMTGDYSKTSNGAGVEGVPGGTGGHTTVINVGAMTNEQLEQFTNQELQRTRQENLSKPGGKG